MLERAISITPAQGYLLFRRQQGNLQLHLVPLLSAGATRLVVPFTNTIASSPTRKAVIGSCLGTLGCRTKPGYVSISCEKRGLIKSLHSIRPAEPASCIHCAGGIDSHSTTPIDNLPSCTTHNTSRLSSGLRCRVPSSRGVGANTLFEVLPVVVILLLRGLLSTSSLSDSLGVLLLLDSQHGKDSPIQISPCSIQRDLSN